MNQFTYMQPNINRLMSKLRIRINPKYKKFCNPGGPEGRLKLLRQTVTALVKYERIELSYARADEARGYAERLISEAIRHGDLHKPTMDMANFWLVEKQLIHKLFKVLAPRFTDFETSYTALYKAPMNFKEDYRARSVIELKGNPFPPMIFDGSRNKNIIHNVLMEEARKEYRKEKSAEIAKRVSESEKMPKQHENSEEKEKAMLQAAIEVAEGEQLLKSVECEHPATVEPDDNDSVSTLSEVASNSNLVTDS